MEAYETSQMESITRIALCSATLHVGWLHQSLDSYTVESSISLRLSTAIQYEGVYSHTAITEQHSGVTECESELKPDSMPISVGLNWSFGVSHHPYKAVKQPFIASRRSQRSVASGEHHGIAGSRTRSSPRDDDQAPL